ncbi:hypothetical protein ACFW35_09980 [Fictibacillus sp. NPDC058756]|uniref:hypothetical protein n=1 Tax=Fictibacillus sp. NPDC058756 TaxID=3346625 RepID=UPI0036AE8ECC
MAQSGRRLTARPAESEATWNGKQLLSRATKFKKTAFLFTFLLKKWQMKIIPIKNL